jgi:hypothetical protein
VVAATVLPSGLCARKQKRTVSYEWVQDNCTVEPEMVLKNTRANSTSKFDNVPPKFVDDIPPETLLRRVRSLRFRDQATDVSVLPPYPLWLLLLPSAVLPTARMRVLFCVGIR